MHDMQMWTENALTFNHKIMINNECSHMYVYKCKRHKNTPLQGSVGYHNIILLMGGIVTPKD